MSTTFYKVIKGYTAQARWFAANLEGAADPVTGAYAGDWTQIGWTRLGNGAVKPVFRMNNGTPVAILNGKTHLHAIVSEVPAGCVFETEDAAHAAKGGW